MREIFRGVVVKSWVALPVERLNFRVRDETLFREVVKFCSEHFRERCKALHAPEHEKISLSDEVKQTNMMLLKGRKLIMKDM